MFTIGTMFKIREAQPDDIANITNLWSDFMVYNAEFNDSFETNKTSKTIFSNEMREKINDSNSRLSVAEIDKELIGFCFSYISLKPKFFSLSKFGFIGDLYVMKEHRRKKIGHALVDDALRFFNRKSINQIELLVAIKNVGTIKFWESLGFDHLLTWMYKRD